MADQMFPPNAPIFFDSWRPRPGSPHNDEPIKGPYVERTERQGYLGRLKLCGVLRLVSRGFNTSILPHFLHDVWFSHPFQIIRFADVWGANPILLSHVRRLRIDIAFNNVKNVTLPDLIVNGYNIWPMWDTSFSQRVSFLGDEFSYNSPEYQIRRLINSAMRWFPNLVAFDGGHTGTGIRHSCTPLPGYLSGLINSLATGVFLRSLRLVITHCNRDFNRNININPLQYLEELSVDCIHFSYDDISLSWIILDPSPKRLQGLKWLSITGSPETTPLDYFEEWELPALTHLYIDTGGRFDSLATFLHDFGKNLQTLSLRGGFYIQDLDQLCPVLTHFEVDWTVHLALIFSRHPSIKELMFLCDKDSIGTTITPISRLGTKFQK
ncbi:hypothetical protein M422DRAFT_271834 [Sphaerobolus stellatus SS14]|uniref:F-box domain-containing protein n=1 Tax=Sphaerobolus stellatus (strain SS14) TaxID=990650 RepID=A0A0C9UD01_SPHS4|nr:hypothetical protein M422DRAFT_271834 [Sphaerobolus stellatus SS14]